MLIAAVILTPTVNRAVDRNRRDTDSGSVHECCVPPKRDEIGGYQEPDSIKTG